MSNCNRCDDPRLNIGGIFTSEQAWTNNINRVKTNIETLALAVETNLAAMTKRKIAEPTWLPGTNELSRLKFTTEFQAFRSRFNQWAGVSGWTNTGPWATTDNEKTLYEFDQEYYAFLKAWKAIEGSTPLTVEPGPPIDKPTTWVEDASKIGKDVVSPVADLVKWTAFIVLGALAFQAVSKSKTADKSSK